MMQQQRPQTPTNQPSAAQITQNEFLQVQIGGFFLFTVFVFIKI